VKENRGGEKVTCNARSFGNDGYAKSDDTNIFLCNALKFAEKIFFKPASCMLESRSILTILRQKKCCFQDLVCKIANPSY
jgi:hypothetical protein